ncbi:GNAT family N-acetyltransferase [Saccharibacillus kuerlensis]|uniref:Acetyltransferase YjbC n=1 Tax=Saccharibacillus kuerlensis TaxID=459527 RepID=A0ABQ2L8W4_9BACL|nr:GNAT family N-acetyltransferase [Saccharibacillus kuerlensis]GGO07083.1 putative acetyltransferase YjbC [Saccharibacillus kuerlensis]
MTSWFDRLGEYFPIQEMKSLPHMKALLADKPEQYRVAEAKEYVTVYLEKDSFIFVDFMLVSPGQRSSGVGSRVIEDMKSKGKPIVLEVEPETPDDPDTGKRIRFYEKLGFRRVESIRYVRTHVVTGMLNIMDVYCWSPKPVTDEWVYERMKESYEQVHAYRSEEYYGKFPQPVDEVLSLTLPSRPTIRQA